MQITLPIPDSPVYVVQPGAHPHVVAATSKLARSRLAVLWVTSALASALAAVIYWWGVTAGVNGILAFIAAAGVALIAGYFAYAAVSRRREASFYTSVAGVLRPAIPDGAFRRMKSVSPENDWEAAGLWQQMLAAEDMAISVSNDPFASRGMRREAKKLTREARRYEKRIVKLLR